MKVWLKRYTLFALIIPICLSLVSIVQPVGAAETPTHCDYQFYSANTIIGYDPCEETCSTGSSVVSGNNKDYAGNPILNEEQLKQIAANQPFYEKAAKKAAIPWQIIAVIHLREFGLKKSGPSNGYGPYQITPSAYPIGPYSDEQFQDATDKAAVFMKAKADGRDLTNPENVKYIFFAYNGTAGSYKTQAKRLGFNDTQADNGDGSPYVVNRLDQKRDASVEPTKSNNTWGQIKQDYGSIVYPANLDYGAYVVYTAITGGLSGGECSTGLAEGGMDLDAAKAFMETYKTAPDSIDYIGGAGRDCSGGPLANCVSFSVYFINKYTDLTGFASGPTGNGVSVAGNVASRNSGVMLGKEPRPYAVFSRGGSGGFGHTGIVLGVDTAANKIIIGEAGCGQSSTWTSAREYPLDKWSDGTYTYAYVDDHLKEGLSQ